MNDPLWVLLVDGHQGVREGLTARLRRDPRVGTVAAVDSLADALGYGRHFSPDVVLCDPTTVGWDAAEVVRQLTSLGRPLVVLTPSLLEQERASLGRAGATVMLLKGCSFSTLLAALETASTGQTGCLPLAV